MDASDWLRLRRERAPAGPRRPDLTPALPERVVSGPGAVRFGPYREGGVVLRELREVHGLTQEDLARVLGVTRNSVRSWERGDGRASSENRERIRRVLGADPWEDVNRAGEDP